MSKKLKKVWLRSEKVDPKRCSFLNGQRHRHVQGWIGPLNFGGIFFQGAPKK
jgi:hypothetical protein